MSALQIDANTLKTVRKARKLGRPRLAKLAGLTERQIARLEGAAPARDGLTEDTILRIAHALQIPVGTLVGEMGLIDADLKPASESTCTSGCCG